MAKSFGFDNQINRTNTRSYKWDYAETLFGAKDLLPLWVADMDFLTAPAITERLVQRAQLGSYGYAVRTDSYLDAIVSWYRRRHEWTVQSDSIVDSPSVVTSLSLAVQLFSEPGDQIVIQTPVYYPFYEVIRGNDRVVAASRLRIENNRYEMDFDHMESLFQGGAKLLLLCSPHNPGGRVWSEDELRRLGDLCLQYGVHVVSDEIHGDLVHPGRRHLPFASLSPEIDEITITCLSATKTFNLPGLHTSFMAVSNVEARRKINQRMKLLGLSNAGHFAQDAVEAAFNKGEAWLDELLEYIGENIAFARQYLSKQLPQVKPMIPDATYLLWVDCRSLGLDSKGLKELMFHQAKVAFSEGSGFGEDGTGWLRINVACPRSLLAQALEQFCEAARKL
ncbi:MalY/PatB family protein [Paenibacillus harenae]|uniref:cysteine-S-conjugate beta-lyase n=1 Tax=Paenibacillus harenae TaxID=306543 RepID=A0ABT9U1U1_PAEHA|nr:MalY/PatB family protein [Paenibacillus harenae]MDQ0112675.1 cystathionine beta-lyase [Paenibacillus harenae]